MSCKSPSSWTGHWGPNSARCSTLLNWVALHWHKREQKGSLGVPFTINKNNFIRRWIFQVGQNQLRCYCYWKYICPYVESVFIFLSMKFDFSQNIIWIVEIELFFTFCEVAIQEIFCVFYKFWVYFPLCFKLLYLHKFYLRQYFPVNITSNNTAKQLQSHLSMLELIHTSGSVEIYLD